MDDVGDFVRQPGKSGSWILHVEQCAREPVEVVDHARLRHRRDRRGVDVPVCADHQDGPGPRGLLPEGSPRGRIAIDFERVHWTAVSNEHGRQCIDTFGARLRLPHAFLHTPERNAATGSMPFRSGRMALPGVRRPHGPRGSCPSRRR